MWIVAKIKNKNFKIFSKKFERKIKRSYFLLSKNKGKRFKQKSIRQYVFCHHKLFSDVQF